MLQRYQPFSRPTAPRHSAPRGRLQCGFCGRLGLRDAYGERVPSVAWDPFCFLLARGFELLGLKAAAAAELAAALRASEEIEYPPLQRVP